MTVIFMMNICSDTLFEQTDMTCTIVVIILMLTIIAITVHYRVLMKVMKFLTFSRIKLLYCYDNSMIILDNSYTWSFLFIALSWILMGQLLTTIK